MEKKKKEKLPNSSFQQQNLKAWQPLLTPKLVIITFWIITLIFGIIGGVVLDASSKVVEYTKRYDDRINLTQSGMINISIDKKMEKPIYFYYKLTEFYQNHRRYVKSRCDAQLRGDLSSACTECDPLRTDEEGKIFYPCGLIANSFFNDTFTSLKFFQNGKSTPIESTDTGIAWPSDVKEKFKKVDTNSDEFLSRFTTKRNGVDLPNVTDENFIVWMRTAGLPTFKKLNKRILNMDIPENSIFSVMIRNEFPVNEFGGTKSIVLSTTSWLGGKNEFLGWAYITVSILCLILALAFCCKDYHSPRKLGDMTYYHFSGVGKKS